MPANLLRQLEETGYLDRDEEQGRDEHNRFLPYNYIVRDIPEASTRYSTGSAWVASKVWGRCRLRVRIDRNDAAKEKPPKAALHSNLMISVRRPSMLALTPAISGVAILLSLGLLRDSFRQQFIPCVVMLLVECEPTSFAVGYWYAITPSYVIARFVEGCQIVERFKFERFFDWQSEHNATAVFINAISLGKLVEREAQYNAQSTAKSGTDSGGNNRRSLSRNW
jgi:hypothetical protein